MVFQGSNLFFHVNLISVPGEIFGIVLCILRSVAVCLIF